MTKFYRKKISLYNQKKNKQWWENNPMDYDWEKFNNFKKYSKQWFDFVDNNFYLTSGVYHKDKKNFFNEFINYKKLDKKIVLEIGCGMGLHTEKIILNSKVKRIISIDITKKAIQTTFRRLKLKNLLSSKVKLINCDAEKLPINKDKIDIVWSWGVIHHSAKTENIIKEISRVLKPNGEFKIMVYNKLSIRYLILGGLINGIFKMKLLKKNLHEINLEFTDGYYARHFTKKEIINLFEKKNLFVKKIFVLQDAWLMPIPGYNFLGKIKVFRSISNFLMQKFGWFLYFEGIKGDN